MAMQLSSIVKRAGTEPYDSRHGAGSCFMLVPFHALCALCDNTGRVKHVCS